MRMLYWIHREGDDCKLAILFAPSLHIPTSFEFTQELLIPRRTFVEPKVIQNQLTVKYCRKSLVFQASSGFFCKKTIFSVNCGTRKTLSKASSIAKKGTPIKISFILFLIVCRLFLKCPSCLRVLLKSIRWSSWRSSKEGRWTKQHLPPPPCQDISTISSTLTTAIQLESGK